MRMRRFLAAFLATAMVCSGVPASVFAAGPDAKPAAEAKGELILNKTATLEDDGSYTIDMEAFATGKTITESTTKHVPLDIVLVLDQSGSMDEKLSNGDSRTKREALKAAVTDFVGKVQQDAKTNNVDHRIAIAGFASGEYDGSSDNGTHIEGNQNKWINTGIFDKDGNFKNYRTEDKAEFVYDLYEGKLNSLGSYYVDENGEKVPLEYKRGASNYVQVDHPDTTRTDLYGLVNGQYSPAIYDTRIHTENTLVTDPSKESGVKYYSENGNELQWMTITEPGEATYKPITGNIKSGQNKTYYIDYGNGNFHSIKENKRGTWKDDKGHPYEVVDNYFDYWGDSVKYYAHEKIPGADITRDVLAFNGKEYKGNVYTHTDSTISNWFVGKTLVTEVYELKENQGAWYYNDQKFVEGSQPVYNRRVTTELTVGDYDGALINANENNKVNPSLTKAISKIGASGATRTATGIEMGNKIFADDTYYKTEDDYQKSDRKRIMIVFTDGVPGYAEGSNYSEIRDMESALAVRNANYTKTELGATVYTIGLYSNPDQDQKDLTDQISSNYQNATYDINYITKLPKNNNDKKKYGIEIDGIKYGLRYGEPGEGWNYRSSEGKRKKVSTTAKGLFEYTSNPGTPVDDMKYKYHVKDVDQLNKIFISIQQDISSSDTTVAAENTAILRDIMSSEGFELTNNSVITVNVVPSDVQNATSWKDTKWLTPKEVLSFAVKDTKSANGTYIFKDDGGTHSMSIEANAYMENPHPESPFFHTVDVTGFDYKTAYVAKKHDGLKLQVIITGVKALPTVTTDRNVYTNARESGLWTPASSSTSDDRKLEKAFPKMPQTYMPSKTYVVDYAKPLNLPLSDIRLNAARDVEKDGYNLFDTKKSNVELNHKYGNVDIRNRKLMYTPKTMQWDGYDTFYLFGNTTDPKVLAASANANGNAWAKVTVIPANNVYYEDTFVTNESTGTAGIFYDNNWEVINKDATAGQNEGAIEGDFDNQGWIPVLQDEHGDTDDTSHHGAAVKDENGNFVEAAKATFTFKGTGVDVYSRTNGASGTIMARLLDSKGNLICTKIVDTLSASGEYFQIPTLTFHDNGENVPLNYDTYTVELYVTGAATNGKDPGDKDRFDYYLDGIRVYNPILNGDPVVDQAYGSDELNAAYFEVRDALLDANSFNSGTTTGEAPVVFVDQFKENQKTTETAGQAVGTGVNTSTLAVYEDFGPKNEVYLKPGQSISFKVKKELIDPNNNVKLYIGLKSPEGKPVQVEFSNYTGMADTVTMAHTADMYYSVVPDKETGVITITNSKKNTENELLSITKLKVVNSSKVTEKAEVFDTAVTVEELMRANQTFAFEAEKQAASQKPVAPSNPDVDIENPETPVDPNAHTMEEIKAIISQIFDGFRNWI